MEAQDTLITPQEVVQYGPGDKHESGITDCSFIVMKEEKLFRECLGWDFYLALIADRIVYDTYTSFVYGTNYSVGDIILENGILYECIQATTGTQTLENVLYWKVAPKFVNTDYEFLWRRYLRTLLAFTISHTSLVYKAVNLTDQGLVRKKGENFDAADMKDVYLLKGEYAGDIRDILKNMDEYIMANKDKFPDYIKIKENDNLLCKSKDGNCGYDKKDFYGFNLY